MVWSLTCKAVVCTICRRPPDCRAPSPECCSSAPLGVGLHAHLFHHRHLRHRRKWSIYSVASVGSVGSWFWISAQTASGRYRRASYRYCFACRCRHIIAFRRGGRLRRLRIKRRVFIRLLPVSANFAAYFSRCEHIDIGFKITRGRHHVRHLSTTLTSGYQTSPLALASGECVHSVSPPRRFAARPAPARWRVDRVAMRSCQQAVVIHRSKPGLRALYACASLPAGASAFAGYWRRYSGEWFAPSSPSRKSIDISK